MTCPVNPAHGRVYDLDSGNYYCPHSDHYRDGKRNLFTPSEILEGHVGATVRLAKKVTQKVRRK